MKDEVIRAYKDPMRTCACGSHAHVRVRCSCAWGRKPKKLTPLGAGKVEGGGAVGVSSFFILLGLT